MWRKKVERHTIEERFFMTNGELSSLVIYFEEVMLRVNSFVLYKNRPARVTEVATKKITVDVARSKPVSVRPKDVTLLHIGPLASLAQLTPPDGDVMTAWELMQGETTFIS